MPKFDFGGWATKNDLKCADGRTIRRDAFKDNHGKTVPLVWQHRYDSPENILGHALLENRTDGVYAYCAFNDTPQGKQAKSLVQHGDICSLSIYANRLQQNGGDVLHGMIREVSLVVAGANPGAVIDTPVLAHDDYSETEGTIWTGESLELSHADKKDNEDEKPEDKAEQTAEPTNDTKANTKTEDNSKEDKDMANESEKTVKDVFDSMTEEQKNVVYFMIGQALQDAGKAPKTDNKPATKDEEDEDVKHNAFESDTQTNDFLTHDEMTAIVADAQRLGSMRQAVLAHGIQNLELLFPDAKMVGEVATIDNNQEWVSVVLNGIHKTPWARIKTVAANLTADEARAKGYIKGNEKTEEVFPLLQRTTDPTTVYKKQHLDRDDLIDIKDFDTVAYLKNEMRGKLNEELARAILIGDGRAIGSPDKIKEDRIRPIWTDDKLYTIHTALSMSSGATTDDVAKALIKAAVKSRAQYKGKGQPIMFVEQGVLSDMLLLEDSVGRRLYNNMTDLATAMTVSKIVEVPLMAGQSRKGSGDDAGKNFELLALIVNLSDYNAGTDKGGEVTFFDDFDIDYNQQKYLIETRMSGALVTPYSAIAIERVTTE